VSVPYKFLAYEYDPVHIHTHSIYTTDHTLTLTLQCYTNQHMKSMFPDMHILFLSQA